MHRVLVGAAPPGAGTAATAAAAAPAGSATCWHRRGTAASASDAPSTRFRHFPAAWLQLPEKSALEQRLQDQDQQTLVYGLQTNQLMYKTLQQ